MNSKQVTLAYKLTINNTAQAKDYNIDRQYTSVVNELTDIFKSRGIDDFRRIPKPMLLEINTVLNQVHAQTFTYYLKPIDVVQDVFGTTPIPIDAVKIYLKSFEPLLGNLELDVIAITEQLTLLDTIGEFAVLKGVSTNKPLTNLVTVRLSDSCVIYSAEI